MNKDSTSYKSKIKRLSESGINRIAAGEVVERPVAVVKELIENSIDAQATSINVVFRRGGKTLITVRDNGIGLSPEEMPLAFCRYTTSKLPDENLDNILHFGFRGEALAAISHVSCVTISSRQKDCDAWKMIVEGGIDYDELNTSNAPKAFPTQHDFGTTIEVSDLFCFTPNRLRFLRSEQSENAACIELVQRLALSFSKVDFNLQINDKNIFHYKALTHDENNTDALFEHRVTEVLGEEFIQNSVPINYEDDLITVTGYASIPTYSRLTFARQKQYCYVNGRMVRDQFLTAIIRAVYSGVIPDDRYPTVVLFINVRPDLVDVNVHPNKLQVRFWQETKVKEAVFRAIRSNFGKSNIASTVKDELIERVKNKNHYNSNNFDNFDKLNSNINNDNYQQKISDFLSDMNNLDNDDIKSKFKSEQANVQFEDGVLVLNKKSDKEVLNDKSNIHYSTYKSHKISNSYNTFSNNRNYGERNLGNAICQINKTYIIASSDYGLVIVDQHAVHERLVLQSMKKCMSSDVDDSASDGNHSEYNNRLKVQLLLIPQIIDMDETSVERLCEITKDLKKFGIEIERNGINQIILKSIPSIVGGIDAEELLRDIANDSKMYESILSNEFNKIYSNMACRSSIRAGREMSIYEMNVLLRLMEQNDFISQCNHGRPTYVILGFEDINKIFERT